MAGTYIYSDDGHGNVVGLANVLGGELAAQYEYGPFGEVLQASGPLAAENPFRFSTKYQDPTTSLMDFGLRHYDPEVGRWLSRDPHGEEGGLNLYAFVGNDPLNAIDPLGAEGFWPAFISGSAHDATQVAARSVSGTIEGVKLLADIAGFLAADLAGYGQTFAGSSMLFQHIAARPHCYNADNLRRQILGDIAYAELNVVSLGTFGALHAAQTALSSGDYTGLQDYFAGLATGALLSKISQAKSFSLGTASARPERALASMAAADRSIGKNLAAPNFYSVPNRGGGRVWLSKSVVTQEDFEPLVAAGQREGRVTILTGTHGMPGGRLIPERDFFYEDLDTWIFDTRRVKLIDVTKLSPRQLRLVANRDGRVICAWCYSEQSDVIHSALKQ